MTGTGEQCLSTSYFRIASISKTITAMATMQLVEQNKLKLIDKIFSRKGKGNWTHQIMLWFFSSLNFFFTVLQSISSASCVCFLMKYIFYHIKRDFKELYTCWSKCESFGGDWRPTSVGALWGMGQRSWGGSGVYSSQNCLPTGRPGINISRELIHKIPC